MKYVKDHCVQFVVDEEKSIDLFHTHGLKFFTFVEFDALISVFVTCTVTYVVSV